MNSNDGVRYTSLPIIESSGLSSSDQLLLMAQLMMLQQAGALNEHLSEEDIHAALAQSVETIPSSDNSVAVTSAFAGFKSLIRGLSPSLLSSTLQAIRILPREDLSPDRIAEIVYRLELLADSEHALSPSLADVMIRLVGMSPNDRVYLPYGGSAALMSRIINMGARFRVTQPDLSHVGLLFYIGIHGQMIPAYPEFSRPKTGDFDVAIANPPFNSRSLPKERIGHLIPDTTIYNDMMFLERLPSAADRKAVVLLSYGALTRTNSGDIAMKEALVRHGRIESVIQFPPGMLPFANAGCALLVLRGNKLPPCDSVLMVSAEVGDICKDRPASRDPGERCYVADAGRLISLVERRENSEASKLVSAQELGENFFSLLPKRYLGVAKAIGAMPNDSASLQSLVEIIRPLTVSSNIRGEHFLKEVAASDIGEDLLVHSPSKTLQLSSEDFAKAKKSLLLTGDVLLSFKGNVGRVALVESTENEQWCPNQSFVILRLGKNSDRLAPEYLARFLASEKVQNLIQTLTTGTSLKFLQSNDISLLEIPIPIYGEQRRVVELHRKIVSIYHESYKLVDEARSIASKLF